MTGYTVADGTTDAASRLGIALTDSPMAGAVNVRALHHLLGECGVTFFALPQLAARYRRGFPGSLEGAPMLLPTDNTVLSTHKMTCAGPSRTG